MNINLNITFCIISTIFVNLISFAQEAKKIEFSADEITYDKRLRPDAQRLKGNVAFYHEGIVMYCDSADYYSQQNSLDAYHNIHIRQGDTINLYGDFLKYDGNNRIAKVRDNVRLEHNRTYLVTDSLHYDRNKNMAWYSNYGKMVDSINTLESKNGNYYTQTKDFIATDSVVLKNPDYIIYSDTLKYNTESEKAFFFGPTEIISDTNYIYCENGWYDTKTDIAQISENSFYKNDKQILKGDSIYYERYYYGKHGFGEAFRNVELIDTSEKIILKGHYAYYYEYPERIMLIDSALCIHIIEGDSLFFHADTLRSFYDTIKNNKTIIAYYKAKMYKSDFQGKCDSLVYMSNDSTIKLYHSPVLWSDKNQITADYIEIHTKRGDPDYSILENSSMVISEEDSLRYNQMRGKNMTGYFKDGNLYRIDVTGNGETVYYAKDDDGFIGVNKALGSYLRIILEDNEVSEIIFNTTPEGTMYPVNQLQPEELKLKGFIWLAKCRPANMKDIFN